MILTRLLFLWDALKYWFLELRICRTVNKVACISNVDRLLLIQRGGRPDKLHLLPLPYETNNVFTYGRMSILFVGLMSWSPNKLGFQWFVDTVYPLVKHHIPTVSVTVVGGRVEDDLRQRVAHDPSIHFTGEVPQTRDYYRQAGVVVVPIFLGGGIRIKLLEALSYGMPVVSTTVGAEGIVDAGNPTRPIVLADTRDQFAKAIVTLLTNRKQAVYYSRQAVSYMKEQYSEDLFREKMRLILT